VPVLVYLDATGAERQHPLPSLRMSVGRLPDNGLVLNDTLVSRKHCVFEQRGTNWHVRDEASRFGTFVNEEKVAGERPLRVGDVVRVGNTNLRFLDADAASSSSLGANTGSTPSESTGSMRTDVSSAAISKDSIESLLAEARVTGEDLLKWIRDPNTVNLSGTPTSTMIGLVERVRRAEAVFAEVKREFGLASTLNEVGKLINLVTDLDTVLQLTMDMALRALGAESGFILLRETERASGSGRHVPAPIETLVPRLSRNMGDIKGFSTSIAEKVVAEAKPVLTMDAQVDPRFKQAQSIIAQAVRAVMCVPLRNKDFNAIGAIYVEGRPGNPMFSERGVEFLSGFAGQAAISIENAQLIAQHAQEEQKRKLLSRYFSEQVITEIVSHGDAEMGGTAREITVLFTDIRGFTSMLERLDPASAVEMLNDYFTELVDEVLAEGGTLDKFTGDGVMAFWGAPTEQPDQALRATRAALRMQARMKPLLDRWEQQKRPFLHEARTLTTGIGVHTGMAVVGSIGSPRRLEYTAIGDAVNLAARMQALAAGGEVLVTESTLEQIAGKVVSTALPPVQIRGKSALVPIFKVTALRDR
jgi:adenylate cyclase